MTAGDRYVVIGAGMVGIRFAGLLHAELERLGITPDITVIGEEPHAPYNRVLLSEVVAGRTHVTALGLPAPHPDVRQRLDVAVTAIDRDQRRVHCADGSSVAYDHLVLATGARARIPEIPGMIVGGAPGPGVHVLRTLDDARDLIAAAAMAGQIAVLGGGVLGVELATALRTRGANVTLVHSGTGPMDRQLGPEAAAVLADRLRDDGITVITDARTTGVGRTADGRLRAVELADGRLVAADVLVVSTGIVPATGLAAGCGLSVDGGIVVGADLRSVDDPRIAAIGDCAQPPEGVTGLVAPGWEQARRLTRDLAGHPLPVADAGPPVVRLKAGQVSAVSLGDTRKLTGTGSTRVVALHDPTSRRSIRVAVDGHRLLAAACVGAPGVAAELQVAFERGLPLPNDPALLLIDRSLIVPQKAEGSLARIPDSATLCRCSGVTKGQIIAAHRAGDRTIAEVAERTRATTGCGGCTSAVTGALEWLAEVEAGTEEPPTARTAVREGLVSSQ